MLECLFFIMNKEYGVKVKVTIM